MTDLGLVLVIIRKKLKPHIGFQLFFDAIYWWFIS